MKTCPDCGKAFGDEYGFCPACGTKLVVSTVHSSGAGLKGSLGGKKYNSAPAAFFINAESRTTAGRLKGSIGGTKYTTTHVDTPIPSAGDEHSKITGEKSRGTVGGSKTILDEESKHTVSSISTPFEHNKTMSFDKRDFKKPEEYKNLIVYSLLLIFTFGIYFIYQIYRLTKLSNEDETMTKRSPGLQLLLCLILPYVYWIYWAYQTGKRFENILKERTGKNASVATPSLILTFFGLEIIAMAVMQDKINKYVGGVTGTNMDADGFAKCKECGIYFPNDLKQCPNCEAAYEKKFYENIYVKAIIIYLIVTMIITVISTVAGAFSTRAIDSAFDFADSYSDYSYSDSDSEYDIDSNNSNSSSSYSSYVDYKKTTETTADKITDVHSRDDWKLAYIEYVRHGDGDNMSSGNYDVPWDENTYFQLIDVDGDEVPELYRSGGFVAQGEALLTYANGKLVIIDSYASGYDFEGNSGYLWRAERDRENDIEYYRYFKFNHGNMTLLMEAAEIDPTADRAAKYVWDGKKVSEEEFDRLRKTKIKDNTKAYTEGLLQEDMLIAINNF